MASIQELPKMDSYKSSIVLIVEQPAAVAAPAMPVLPPAAPLPVAQPPPLV